MFLSSDGFCQTGSISGTVTGGGTPLEGFAKLISQPTEPATIVPLVSGSYLFPNLPDGYYFVQTLSAHKNETSYIDELYNDVQIGGPNMPYLLGTQLLISNGSAIANVNFDLQLGGTVAGTAVGPNGPMAGLKVYLITSLGGFYTSQSVNPADGKFTFSNLPTGNYFVGIANERDETGLMEEMYDNVFCPGLTHCDKNLEYWNRDGHF